MRTKAGVWLTIAAASVIAVSAQEKSTFVSQFCVKIVPGQSANARPVIADLTKMARQRVEAGEMTFYSLLTAVIPQGTTARCDLIMAAGFVGFPPEPPNRAQSEAVAKQANLSMSYADLIAKRDATLILVSNDLFRNPPSASVGQGVPPGSYVRFNLYKVKPGHTAADFLKIHVSGWKAYAEEMARKTPGIGWRAEVLTMPAGTGVEYNALTLDMFPNWNSINNSGSAEMWSKVHPDLKIADYLEKIGEVCDRHKVELYRVADVVMKK